jgi:hypothetical protein
MIEVEKVDIPITTFGSQKEEHIVFWMCDEGKTFSRTAVLGLLEVCKDCKKRFICATERKS